MSHKLSCHCLFRSTVGSENLCVHRKKIKKILREISHVVDPVLFLFKHFICSRNIPTHQPPPDGYAMECKTFLSLSLSSRKLLQSIIIITKPDGTAHFYCYYGTISITTHILPCNEPSNCMILSQQTLQN